MSAAGEDRTCESEFMRLARNRDEAAIERLRKKTGNLNLLTTWSFWADRRQLPPEGEDWRIWLMMAGRGFGKTRAGAEWVRSLAEAEGGIRIALVGATLEEARALMVEGESGLLNIGPAATRPRFEPSRRQLTWRSGAIAKLYSGENPEGLRGPEHHYAWCDELAKWSYAEESWDNLMLTMRGGELPRTLVTTTPRPVPMIRRLVGEQGVRLVRGRTLDNDHLSDSFRTAVQEIYGGTRLGRQELDGELIEEAEGALWSRDLIEACRVREVPEMRRVVIGVDPPAGIGAGCDECGIIAVGLGEDGHGYVLEDASIQGETPEGWARRVAEVARRKGADLVIAEANNGGAMVESVLLAADVSMPVKRVHAARGKVARAEPVATLYAKRRVFHRGAFPDLEDQMAGLVTGGDYCGPGRSPDRADALVWALTELLLGGRPEPRISHLLRGRRGSEWATNGHVTGERFVLILADTLLARELPLGTLGAGVSLIAAGVGDGTGVEATLLYQGRAVRPPAPVHLDASRRADGAIEIAWTRRSRAGWSWLDGGDALLGEESERYRVVVTPSVGWSRIVETVGPGFAYDIAMQMADGSSGATGVMVSVAQLGTLGASLPSVERGFAV